MEFISREPQSKRDKTVDFLRIRELVRALTGDPEQAIMVSELACLEEDCPPIEMLYQCLMGIEKLTK
jgi:hypothetical protein